MDTEQFFAIVFYILGLLIILPVIFWGLWQWYVLWIGAIL